MNNGAAAHGQRISRNCNNMYKIRNTFTALPVNVIDSIVITEELNTNRILAEWIAYDPRIAVFSDLTAAQAVKLFINWSDRNGTVILHQGDFFTFTVPDIFIHDYITNVTNVPITNEAGEVVATYSIYDNSNNMKEVKITFTDYVENHTNISGDFWMLLFVGSVTSTEQRILQFVVNDTLAASGDITINSNLGMYNPRNNKIGYSLPTRSAGGYYIFEWLVYFNMNENAVNGFNTLEGFSFEDIIPADSPHIFLTDEIRQELGILPADYATKIGEYTGADSVPPGSRYQVFRNHFNSTGANIWYNFIQWHTIAGGLTTTGINGDGGLNVSNIEVGDKLFSADLGTITRPTVLNFYTISTIRIRESALGDTEVVKLFKNTFNGSYGEDLSSSLALYRFEAGGTAQGINGDYSFSFTKVNREGDVLPGAMFSLFTSNNFSAGADRFVFSGTDGIVSFNHLPAGTYYLLETSSPYGYLPNDTVYRVVLSSAGFEIYYGENFENRLSDVGNRIINQSEFEIQPVPVIFTGRKNLIGAALEDGMFSFAVRDTDGNIAATGTNNADGSILFGSIVFDVPGIFIFTVEEVMGTDSRIIYDGSVFTVIVTVSFNGDGNLEADVTYPNGGIVFYNRLVMAPVSVMLTGTKNLTGRTLEIGMFNFIVRDIEGNIAATGTNNADGSILFGRIEFDAPGVYTFTVEEVIANDTKVSQSIGTDSGIIYDGSIFTVTVIVTVNGNGNLVAEVIYPSGGIVFNNHAVIEPEKPCQCVPCCKSCCGSCCRLCCKSSSRQCCKLCCNPHCFQC